MTAISLPPTLPPAGQSSPQVGAPAVVVAVMNAVAITERPRATPSPSTCRPSERPGSTAVTKAAVPSLGRYDVLPAAAPPTASQRLVWDCRCGAIAIDVVGKQVFVDGDLVEPATD